MHPTHAEHADHAIVVTHVSHRFPRTGDALREVSCQVPSGSLFGLIGPSGAGKTTLLRILMNFIQPTAGETWTLGTNSRALAPRDFARIGYVSDGQQRFDWMTIRQLLAYLRPFYPAWDDGLANRLLHLLDLPIDGTIGSLSRGMRMKVALLTSLPYRPRLLVLDEPFSGLDPLVRDDVVNAMLELAGDDPETRGSGIIASHDLDEIERLVDWIGYLEGGRLLFARPIADVLATFRRIDIILADGNALPAVTPSAWLNVTPAGRALRFAHKEYAGDATERELATRFPGAQIQSTPLSLREIFLAIGTRERTPVETR